MRDDDTLLTMPEVEALTRLSKPTVYQMIREGRFPKQVRLGPNKVAWLRSEVLGWIGEKADARELPEDGPTPGEYGGGTEFGLVGDQDQLSTGDSIAPRRERAEPVPLIEMPQSCEPTRTRPSGLRECELMADVPKPNVEDAVRFLEWKRPGGPWPITVADPDWKRGTPTVWAATADEVRALVARHSGVNGLFYTTAQQRDGVNEKPKKEDLVDTCHFHVDLDPPKGIASAEIDEWVEAELVRVREQTHSPKPSAIIRSGNGLHLLWTLDQPMFIGGTSERWTDVEERTRALCSDFRADGSTWNCDRLLRLPGADNLPNEKKRRAGRVAKPTWIEELHADRVYSLADFRCESQTASPSGKPGETAPSAVERDEVAGLNSPDELEAWGVPVWARAVIVEGTDPTDPDRWGGDRSAAQWAVTCELARRGVPPGLIVGILTDKVWGISAHVLDQKRPLEYAWKQVEKAIGLAAAEGEPFQTDKDGKPYANQYNIRLALTKLGVRVRYDRFADRATLNGLDGFGPHLSDAALTRMRLRIEEQYKLKVGKETFCDVVEDAARRDDFHPVVDYLDALAWDGAPRLDGWMTTYLQADDKEYTRASAI